MVDNDSSSSSNPEPKNKMREGTNISFKDIVKGQSYSLPVDEVALLKRIEDFHIPDTVADVVYRDPIKSSKEIPYYRNTSKHILSVFKNLPERLERLQDINIFLMKLYGEYASGLVIQVNDFDEYKSKQDSMKVGNIAVITTVYQEITFLLQIKEGIDYENSQRKRFHEVTTFFFKKVKNSMRGNYLDTTLTKTEHSYLQNKLNLATNTLVYKLFYQLISIVGLLYHKGSTEGPVRRSIDALFDAKTTLVDLTRKISEIKEIEPLYQWNAVLSPIERQEMNEYLMWDPIKTYNSLIKKVKENDIDAKARAVKAQKKLKDELPSNFLGVIYGRLKVLHELKKSNPEEFDFVNKEQSSSSQGAKNAPRKTPTYSKLIGILSQKKQNSAELFAESRSLICLSRDPLHNNPVSIRDVLKTARFQPGSTSICYPRAIMDSKSYKEILKRKSSFTRLGVVAESIQENAILM